MNVLFVIVAEIAAAMFNKVMPAWKSLEVFSLNLVGTTD